MAYFRLVFVTLIIVCLSHICIESVSAASLVNVSNRLSTSRPSASAPLAANQAGGATQITISDNKSIFLASDSATFWPDTGETLNSGIIVASMSAANTPSAGQRIVYLATTPANAHHLGGAVSVPITATHHIQFTTITAVPVSGSIVLGFPGVVTGDNISNYASPSATTFQLNSVVAGTGGRDNVKILSGTSDITNNVTITNTNPSAGVSHTITLTLDGSTSIGAGVTVKIFLGCSAVNTTACTTYAPRIINPTKSAVAGTSDSWRMTILTRDSGSNTLDNSTIKINTVDAVQVLATVEPTLTFSIAGLTTAQNYQTISGSNYCGSETSNAGIDQSTNPTVVNLGVLSNGQINHAGQSITVSTNGSSGYTITATSSGRFINPATGFWITDANGGNGLTANDTPAPATIAAGTPDFGISPCGIRVPTSSPNWGGVNQTVASGARFSNPWNSGTNGYYATIATYSGGPAQSEVTVIRYAATIEATTPPGLYQNVFTYVVTATF